MRASYLSRRTRRAAVNSFRTTIAHNVAEGDVGFGVGPIGEDESEVGAYRPP